MTWQSASKRLETNNICKNVIFIVFKKKKKKRKGGKEKKLLSLTYQGENDREKKEKRKKEPQFPSIFMCSTKRLDLSIFCAFTVGIDGVR